MKHKNPTKRAIQQFQTFKEIATIKMMPQIKNKIPKNNGIAGTNFNLISNRSQNLLQVLHHDLATLLTTSPHKSPF